MEDNDDLLARIRRSQQITQLPENLNEVENQGINEEIAIQEGGEEAPEGFFKKYSFPLPAFGVLILSIITPFLIFGITQNVFDMEMHFFEWDEYIVLVLLIGALAYWKSCLNRWIEKKGVTIFGRIVRILCNLQIWFWIIMTVVDAYRWYKIG